MAAAIHALRIALSSPALATRWHAKASSHAATAGLRSLGRAPAGSACLAALQSSAVYSLDTAGAEQVTLASTWEQLQQSLNPRELPQASAPV